MKQILSGVVVWIILGVWGFFIFSNMFIEDDVVSIVNESSGIPIENTSNDLITTQEPVPSPEVPEKHTVPMEFLTNNTWSLTDEDFIEDFQNTSPYEFALVLYAIKNNIPDMWMNYWMSLYNSTQDPPFERSEYATNIETSFDAILNNNLDKDTYYKYLLDGAIYFSSEVLENKIEMCKNSILPSDGDDVMPDDVTEYCISLSYIHEAIRENDVSYCSQISYEPQDTELVKNCELLF